MECRRPKVTGMVKVRFFSRPTVVRPYPYRIFYINIDCSTDGMGAVILKADVSEEARNTEAQEKDGEDCEFDKPLEGMRLQPIYFISISMTLPLENSRHSFLG